MMHHAPVYAVAIAAALLMLLAGIGLFTDLLGAHQLLTVAQVMITTIVMIAISIAYWHR